jgi:8-oxo-dGTP diphosphatase
VYFVIERQSEIVVTEKDKHIYVAGAIIVGRVGDIPCILATQRGYGNYAGYWEFPGGKVQDGESPEQAVVREIREELGADITAPRYFDRTEYQYPEFFMTMDCFLCELKTDYKLNEHMAARWVTRTDIGELKWLGADDYIIEQLIKRGVI